MFRAGSSLGNSGNLLRFKNVFISLVFLKCSQNRTWPTGFFSWVETPQHCLGFSPPWRRLLGSRWVLLLCSGTYFCVFSLAGVELLERHKHHQDSVSLWLCVCWSNNLDLKLSCDLEIWSGAVTSTLFFILQGFTHARQTLPTGPQLPLSYGCGPPGAHPSGLCCGTFFNLNPLKNIVC